MLDMKLNKSGFTLVELLASVVILAIMLGVAIPNITEVMKKQRNHVYVEDGKRFATQARTIMNKDTSIRKEPGTCFSLNFLDNGDFDESPNGGVYLKDVSYISYDGKDANNNDIYELTLIECVNCDKDREYASYENVDIRGLSKVKYSTLVDTDDYNSLVKNGGDLNTGGMEADTSCVRGYVSQNASYVNLAKGHQQEFTFNYYECELKNQNANRYAYYEGQKWKEYLDLDNNDLYAETVNNGGYYVVEPFFDRHSYAVKRQIAALYQIAALAIDYSVIRLIKKCENSDEYCGWEYASLDDPIVPSSEGFYEVGYKHCYNK
jgi:prepilin-type N-terminal cleavage/methylation domain-containing protein